MIDRIDHDPIARLRGLRRRLRMFLVLDGMSRLACGLIAILFVVVALDWWVHFPPLVRLAFEISAGAWAAHYSYRRIFKPCVTRVPLDQLALSLRTLDPGLRDRLAGLAAYSITQAGLGSAELWRDISKSAHTELEHVDMTSGLNARRPIRSLSAALMLALGLLLTLRQLPEISSIGAGRLIRPFQKLDWPRWTQIEPGRFDYRVAFGESFLAEMRVVSGDSDGMRAFVHWAEPDRTPQSAMMRREADGRFVRPIENVTADTRVWFTAGDDDTLDRPCMVRVVRRPTVIDARIMFWPPSYAVGSQPRVHSLTDGHVSALAGCRAKLTITADKSLRAGANGGNKPMSHAAFEGLPPMPLDPIAPNGESASVEFVVEASRAFSVVLVDSEGFESRGGSHYQIDAVPDQVPRVLIREPAGNLEVLPSARVEVVIEAEDDVGVESVALLAGRAGVSSRIDLTAPLPARQAGREKVQVAYAWSLTELKLSAGDVIEYYAEARDGYRKGDEVHKPAHSTLLRLSVVDTPRFVERIRQDLLAVRASLRKLGGDVQAVQASTKSMQADFDRGAGESVAIESLGREIQRLGEGGRSALDRVRAVTRRIAMNNSEETDVGRQAGRLAHRMEQDVIRGLSEARTAVDRAAETSQAGVRRDELARSIQSEELAAETLRSLVEEIERWDTFEEVVRKLQDIIDRQEGLIRDVTRLSQSSPAGESIRAAERGPSIEIFRAAAEQSGLQSETIRELSAMDGLARALAETDKPASESLARAHQVGSQQSVAEGMTEAAEAIRGRRWPDAARSQERAAASLRAMWVALGDKPRRELEQLSRQAVEARQRLLKLIAVQEDLVSRNRATRGQDDAASKLAGLADRQSSLESTTRGFVEKLALNNPKSKELSEVAAAAGDQMLLAASHLRDAASDEAEEAQQGAMADLRSALALLDQIEDQTQQALAEKSLAALVEAMQDLRRSQQTIRDATAEIDGRCVDGRPPNRANLLALGRISKQEENLKEPLARIRERAGQAVVFDFVLGRIAESVTAATDLLLSKQPHEALKHQDDVIHRLAGLIEAVDEPKNQDDAAFASESEGGGNGMSPPTPDNPIPSVAELKLLRMMQVELNEQTQANSKRSDNRSARPVDVQDTESLSAAQRRIHELAVKMVEKAANQGGKDKP